jgi:localization factor PodJL
MNSRVSWSVDGIDPSVRDRAEAAARRAGMSLNDWLNSTIGEPAPPNFRDPVEQRPVAASPSRDVADIHQRLDSITSQIEQISQPKPRSDVSREQGVARQLNDAISRLDARLSQISNPQAARQLQEQLQARQQRQETAVERAASQIHNQVHTQVHAQAYRASPPLSPASFDSAIAEIAARQNELDAPPPPPPPPPPRPMPARSAPPIAPALPSGPDFSSLERHLFKITSQIEALQRPDGIEQSIAAFRSELTEIRTAITEAMPRRAIESIETEIRSLARRIDDNRQSTVDAPALANIERALSEIREALGSLMPAEQLAGYDEAIRNLGAKLDMILRANEDPSTVRQLEDAIIALRAIVSNVASNDALARLSEDVHLLSSKVDQLTRSGDNSNSFALLEQRIAGLTAALESREPRQPSDNSEQLEAALRGLSDRIDRLQVGNDNASAFAHLEQRVSHLLERLEASDDPSAPNLGRVEEGLQDVLRHLENQHLAFARFTAENSRPTPELQDPGPQDSGLKDSGLQDSALIDLVKRELSDLRFSHSEAGRQTQDSLEAVHNSLGHVVDRLSTIEGDLRTARSAPPPPPVAVPAPPAAPTPAAAPVEPQAAAPRMAMPQAKPELPNPAAAQSPFVAAPRDFRAIEPPAPPLAISEILVPHTAPPRPTIAPDLPPDHPLEPGTRPSARVASPSERIAASESAISEIPNTPKQPVSSSSFIAAARRAAQAAAAQPAVDAKGSAKSKGKDKTKDANKEPSTITSKIRSVLVAASVVVIVLGTFKMAMTLLDGSSAPTPAPAIENSGDQPAATQPPADGGAKPAAPDQDTPSLTSPTPIGRQSLNRAAPNAPETIASIEIPQSPSAPVATGDITGSIAAPQVTASGRKLSTVQVPPSEKLPDGIAGPMLRTAALKGDPTAAYEIGVRFAEGKGIAPNLDEAAKWYDRAARAGVVPAIFRLGTFYEKGLSVTKDVDIARRYYLQAAERGNAKAMHNMAVLDADGGGKGADYKSASQWFRKAADRGVADSQFNLGILYARGIGVEQNLAESFKWFSLAAAQGDADAVRKRDDIAKRLDVQSLAAAKLAIQTFTPEQQPDDAINVPTPSGGWDSAPVPSAAAKPAAKPVAIKRAAAR